MYAVLYNKEQYIMQGESGENEDVLSEEIDGEIRDELKFLDELEVSTSISPCSSMGLISQTPGSIDMSVNYEMALEGTGKLLNKKAYCNKLEASLEIRDTSNNLRRWQIYAAMLSK